MKKKVLTIVLTLVLCLVLFAVPALAADESSTVPNVSYVSNVPYVKYSWNEATSTLSSTEEYEEKCIEVKSTTTTWTEGWYVVTGDVTITTRVQIKGHVRLILADGCNLIAAQGISVEPGWQNNAELTIYGQKNSTGKLSATGVEGTDSSGSVYYAGIGARGSDTSGYRSGPITIHGGQITATGSDFAPGIGCGGEGCEYWITIYHGTVSAQSGGSSGTTSAIGGITTRGNTSEGYLQIYGGTVTAKSSLGPALGGSRGNSILIAGGVVNASYTRNASTNCAIIGTYGRANTTPSVTISGGVVNITKGEATFYFGDGYGNESRVSITGGIVYRDEIGIVYGETTLEQDLEIPDGRSLIVPDGAELIIPKDVKLTNNGTLQIADASSLGGDGTLAGGGSFTLPVHIAVPDDLVYTGLDLTETAKAGIKINKPADIEVKNTTFAAPDTAYTIDSVPVQNAKTYTVTYGIQSATFSVAKANITATAQQTSVLTYNGLKQTPVVSVTPATVGGATANVTYSWSETSGFSNRFPQLKSADAGTYTLYYKITAANHNPFTGSISVVVNPLPLTDQNTKATFQSMTYNGQPQTPVADLVVDLGNDIKESITGVTWSAVTNVTDTTIAIVENTNFTGSVSMPTGMQPLDLSTVSIEKANTLTYDGTEQTQQIIVKDSEKNIVTDYAVSGNKATTVKTDGNYTLTVSAGNNQNYTDDSITYEWNIAPAPLTVTAVIPETYWGEAPEITEVTVTSGTVYDPDVVTVTGLTAEPENAAAVGDSLIFNVDSTNAVINGSGYENYAVTIAKTAAGKVKAIPLTISGVVMDAESYTYGDAVGYDNRGLSISQPGGTIADADELVYTYTGTANDGTTWNSTTAPTKAGSYTLTVSYDDTVHYDVTPQVISFTIERKPVEMPAQAAAVTYNGAAQTYGVAETAYYSVTGGVQTAANEAGYNVTISLKDSDNTCWVGGGLDDLTHSFVINKALATITAKDQRYQVGTELPDSAAPELDKHYTIEGLFGEDSIGTVTTQYWKDGEEVTPDRNKAGIYDITMLVTGINPNYDVTFVGGTLTIYHIPSYRPNVVDTEGGEVYVNNRNPIKNQIVTITPVPDAGMMVGTVTVTDRTGNPVEVTNNLDGTYSFRQPAGSVTIEVTFRPEACPCAAYSDLNPNAWYHDAVDFVLQKGLMNGVGGDKFDPNGTTSRAMIVTILWRLEGQPVANYLMQFEDVGADTWYTEAVRWAASEKLVEGYNDTAFGPNDPITREQFAAILFRYAAYKGMNAMTLEENLLGYADEAKVSGYAIPAMNWAVGQGILEGANGLLNPGSPATRAQAAALLMRFCGKVMP